MLELLANKENVLRKSLKLNFHFKLAGGSIEK